MTQGKMQSKQKASQGKQSKQQWKHDTLEGLTKGSRVWFKASPVSWQLGTLTSVNTSLTTECIVALDATSGPGSGELVTTQITECVPANPSILDAVPDLTSLSYLNEPSILHDLHQRYGQDLIYTHAGPVLIAVNPFKRVPLYAADQMQHYKARANLEQMEGFTPHVFLTADKAYKAMCQHGQSQSLVISGESGAGKTETTKVAMQYLAGLAGGTGVEGQVLQTNPLLEAFGNARTLRNNNSSRFGKLIEIYFSKSQNICGALIQTYLLEKSRVTHQLHSERNYHVFYQLCKGVSAEEAERYRLPADPMHDFNYLNQSGCSSIEGVDDATDFATLKTAMTAVGINHQQQTEAFEVLAGILWLGNIQFRATTDDSVSVDPGAAVANAAALLQMSEPALMSALTSRNIVARGETIVTQLKMDGAVDARDALAKATYAGLFKWLVDRINAALSVGKKKTETSLSILDIYGFECFKENSFEQLCINYANERLQQQFNKHLFKLEQEVYASEGVDWTTVEFEDNQECLDLIEARPPKSVGILSLLDEECMFPKATDSTFGAKLRENLHSNGRFKYDPKKPTDDFIVEHYAGPVTYSCTRFLDKNKDTLSSDLMEVMKGSGQELMQQLASTVAAAQVSRSSQTVGTRFRDQLKDLITRLDQTALHFVRCVKPNAAQVPSTFDASLVLHQLRCCGVLEVTRIARAGYPTRYLHQEFADRYGILLTPKARGKAKGGALDMCKALLEEFRVEGSMYQMGKTRLFFRAGVLGHLEDTWARIQRSVLVIQSTWRMLKYRRAFLRQRRAAVAIQAQVKGRQARAAYAQLRRRHAAAVAVQTAYRGHKVRQEYLLQRDAAIAVQMGFRRRQLSERVAVRREKRWAAEAVQQALREAKAQEQEQFELIKADFGVDTATVREVLTMWREHGDAFQTPPTPQPQPQQAPQAAEASFADLSPPGALLRQASAQQEQQAATQAGTPPWQPNPVAQTQAVAASQLPPDLERPNLLSSSSHVQLKAWEEYTSKLEEKYVALMTEHESFQRELAAVRGILDDGTDPQIHEMYEHAREETGRPAPPRPVQAARTPSAHLPVAAAIAAYTPSSTPAAAPTPSYQEYESEPEDSEAVLDTPGTTSQGSAQRIGAERGVHLSIPSDRGPVASGARYVNKLSEEFNRKRGLFDDDVAFIREVKEQETAAAGMDPDTELQTLHKRFTNWKHEFKARMKETEKVMKQVDKEERRRSKQQAPSSSLFTKAAKGPFAATPPDMPRRQDAASVSSTQESDSSKASIGGMIRRLSMTKKSGLTVSTPPVAPRRL
ncbi:TPA: hypothetical protein ACH3X2_001422 [Trebouxia sp. C0005]